jgi:beta-lactamase class D
VLDKLQTDNTKRYNVKQCRKQLSPCSTFKIANALIGLEVGILISPDQIFKWDGIKYPVKAWNKDLTLKKTISVSDVPVFQKITTKIGTSQMQAYINKFNYGNKDISGGITQFWLGNSLKISADEQIDFLRKILLNKLKLSKNSLNVIQEILRIKKYKNGTLYGKTGINGTKNGSILG